MTGTDLTTVETRLKESQEGSDRLLQEIAGIKDQLARAASNARQTGNYSDSDWFHAATRALRHKQAAHQKALRETAEIRRELKAMQRANDPGEKTFERRFMTEAKAVLSGELYDTIIARTQSKHSED